MFGSDRRWRSAWNGFIDVSSNVAFERSTVTGRPASVSCFPLAAWRISSSEPAIPSTAWRLTASLAAELRASWTVETAQSTFRPRVSAIERMFAIASLRTFWPSVPGMSLPLESTGDAAPMFVPGAM